MTYVDSGGLRLFYSGSGTGPPVLWHTGGCGDGTMWRTAGYIAALPGYRHMSRYVEDVIAVFDDAGARRAAMIGYSQGARVAYAVAEAHPDRLAGIAGLDSVPDPAERPEDLRDAAA